ncbi:MAG TPA: ATP-binding protein, partial [Bryobacteraceae bacterium]|nr:ATP-binding protein [Bryobacteraceae bacterium]
TVKYVRVVGRPRIGHEESCQFVGAVTDITEQKRAEEAIRRSQSYLAEAQTLTRSGSWAWDVRTQEVFWSQEMFRIFGYAAETTKLTMSTFLERVHPDDRPALEQWASLASTQKGTVDSEEDFRIILPDGTMKHLHSIAHPVLNQRGEVIEVVGTTMDVTERKKAEQELRRLNEELLRLNQELEQRITQRTAQLADANTKLAERNEELARVSRMKSQFLARMSHELRTPLNSIAGFSDLLAEQTEGPLGEIYSDYVEHVKEGAQHLIAMVNDILDISRIEAGRIELQYEEFAAADAISDVLSVTGALAKAKQIDLRHEVPSALRVYADPKRFKQIIYNLVSNAVKFTPPEGTIRMTAKIGDREVCFLVSDTGIGIPQTEHRAIFEEFHQVDAASMGGGQNGAGLGLAITKRLVELHGGRIWVESAPGEGSRFFFTMLAGSAGKEASAEIPANES